MTGRRGLHPDAGWILVVVLLLVALLQVVGRAEAQTGWVTIHSISVDAAGNASYSLVIDATIIEAEKQGAPCDGFSRNDEVSASYDGATIVLISGEKTCRLIILRSR